MWMGTLLGKELIRNCSRYEQWRDFRKRHKAYEDIAINCPTKFPRASTLLKNYEGSHISMKKKDISTQMLTTLFSTCKQSQ